MPHTEIAQDCERKMKIVLTANLSWLSASEIGRFSRCIKLCTDECRFLSARHAPLDRALLIPEICITQNNRRCAINNSERVQNTQRVCICPYVMFSRPRTMRHTPCSPFDVIITLMRSGLRTEPFSKLFFSLLRERRF